MISGVWELVDLAVLHILRETGPIVCNHYGKIKAEKVMKAKFEVRAKKHSTTQTSHYRAYHDSLLSCLSNPSRSVYNVAHPPLNRGLI